jgi:hypothetical protein
MIIDYTHTFEPEMAYPMTKDECRKDGWKSFTGMTFKNQGHCVSHVASDGISTSARTKHQQ